MGAAKKKDEREAKGEGPKRKSSYVGRILLPPVEGKYATFKHLGEEVVDAEEVDGDRMGLLVRFRDDSSRYLVAPEDLSEKGDKR